jgi:hypothetical protein
MLKKREKMSDGTLISVCEEKESKSSLNTTLSTGDNQLI